MKYVAAAAIFIALVFLFILNRTSIEPYLPGWATTEDTPVVASTRHEGQHGGQAGARSFAATTTVAKSGSLPVTRQTIGSVVAVNSAALASPAAGIVAQVIAHDGAEVKAGDLLVQLDDRTIKANITRDQALLAKDQAALDEANITLKRVETLSRSGADTQQQYGDAVAAAKQAAATVDVDNANLAADNVTLSNTQIHASFDGRLGAVLVSPGAYVAAGADVVVLTQMKPVFAEFSLPETDLDIARSAMANKRLTVNVTPTLDRSVDKATTGEVVFIDNAVDTASGTFRMRAEFPNETEMLWPGQSLSVTVNAGSKDNIVIVPTVAVQPHGDGFICFVLRADQTAEMRNVVPALSVGDMTGVSAGLQDGEQVVIGGQAGLVNGAHVDTGATKAKG
ncbi:efflux RND transporter periplasmic adaptor subunit [Neorhizobium sp. JUb45]|uniref:efflux RND transporter periplasmic adaptor subunit n=1 Tax=unclassified Neorhizobium TaxID=2629175 RepID=UPI00105067E1|nr:efflux RND transporter periplasmic adaptor subunit [Neorhizobium sp. JUb45]TCQ95868.1 RND family efflux transporter MFP subunit [Neorhizobium sp. JUb45]